MKRREHPIPELDRKGLREFALLTGGVVGGLFGLFLPWLFELRYPVWPWVVGITLAVWGLAAPGSLRPVYRTWMRFGLLISSITTPVILGIVFLVAILPMGMLMRLARKDPMARRFDEATTTYRVKSETATRENLEKPF